MLCEKIDNGLFGDTAGFLKFPYDPISPPVSQQSFGPRTGDPCPAHPTRKARRSSGKWLMPQILSAVFYVVRTGCQWRLLPHDDFPPWSIVHHYFRLWCLDGTWERSVFAIG